jgi:hypothetical protein
LYREHLKKALLDNICKEANKLEETISVCKEANTTKRPKKQEIIINKKR